MRTQITKTRGYGNTTRTRRTNEKRLKDMVVYECLISDPNNKTNNIITMTETASFYPIVIAFKEGQYGQDEIKAEDVVRPLNHRYAIRDDEEVRTWKKKSHGRMPTYGNCNRCYKSGPLGKKCNECAHDHRTGYVIMVYDYEKILDAITLATILKKGHETARADRPYCQGQDRMQDFNILRTARIMHRDIESYTTREQNTMRTVNLLNDMVE